MNLAIIPARAGSKRIVGKNTRPFCGKPLISYSIEAAVRSALFERVLVSTDSPEIADVARSSGAEVPALRPARLADDYTGLADVAIHELELFASTGREVDYVCCILATAPLLSADDLEAGLRLAKDTGAPGAFSVTTFPYPILRALSVDDEGTVRMVWPEYEGSRSNDLPETFHDAGQFYWLQPQALMRERRIFVTGAKAVRIPRYRVQDIDTPEDWVTAELMYRAVTASHS